MCDVDVKVLSFMFPTYFMALDYKINFQDPIILGRPFLAMGRAIIDMEQEQIMFRLNNDQMIFLYVSFNILAKLYAGNVSGRHY